MHELIEYSLRIAPGLVLLCALYWLVRKKSVEFRLVILVLGFILMRDTMTPLGFWEFGVTEGFVPWVRFLDNPLVLVAFGVTSLVVTFGVVTTNKDIKKLIKWGSLSARAVVTGVIGAIIVVAPFVLLYQFVPMQDRGESVAIMLLPALLLLAFAGNFMEEVLFRGYLQGYFEKSHGAFKAAVISGLLFAVGHIFLATTVTNLGIAVLLFTLYEGLVCAFVRNKQGVIASTITHGLAIFVLASGL